MLALGPRGAGRPLVRAVVYAAGLVAGAVVLAIAQGAFLNRVRPGAWAHAQDGVLPWEAWLVALAACPFFLLYTLLMTRLLDGCSWRCLTDGWLWAGPVPTDGHASPEGAEPNASAPAPGEHPASEGPGRAAWMPTGVADCLPAPRPIGRDVALGLGAAVLALALILGATAVAGWVRFEGAGPPWRGGALTAIGFTVAVTAAALLQGGTEEIVFRGYLMRNLILWRGAAAGVLFNSVAFGVVHGLNPGSGWVPLLNVTLMGVFISALRLRTSLWVAVGFHGGWNAVLLLLSVPCSGFVLEGVTKVSLEGPSHWTGGGFGVEASLLTTLLFTAAGLMAVRMLRGRV